MSAVLDETVEGMRDEIVGWRRHLHRNPELSFEERDPRGSCTRTSSSATGTASKSC
jgi:metal-dependent amidase/aminoacylase/carboxypeptidase family protein